MSLLEELVAYLSDAEVLLLTKEEDETPEDLALVEDLLKQHIVRLAAYPFIHLAGCVPALYHALLLCAGIPR